MRKSSYSLLQSLSESQGCIQNITKYVRLTAKKVVNGLKLHLNPHIHTLVNALKTYLESLQYLIKNKP